MAWLIGIDEAGYGPNLGPFVMTAVGCRLQGPHTKIDLWEALRQAVRRAEGPDDGRIAIDDSKALYSSSKGLMALERSVAAAMGEPEPFPVVLRDLLARLNHGYPGLEAEVWYTGTKSLPACPDQENLETLACRFAHACQEAGVSSWWVESVIVCAPQFNALLQTHGTKGAVLADALARLVRSGQQVTAGHEPVAYAIDKHGGRNTYAAQLQDELAEGIVAVEEEGMNSSAYRVNGIDREVRFCFQPRADATYLCVALASMISKYVRELLMAEFNAFWLGRVPGLKPTAGYPGDAGRFMDAIRPAACKLGLADDAIWRRR
jgi:ribonuclease HII